MQTEQLPPTINFNAPIINNGGTITGNVVYQNGYNVGASAAMLSDKKVREALLALMKATDDAGAQVFTHRYQWWGVYRVLTEFCGFPQKASDFERAITNLDLGDVAVPHCRENYRKVPNECPRLASPNVWLWANFKDTGTDKERAIIAAAMKFLALLGIEA